MLGCARKRSPGIVIRLGRPVAAPGMHPDLGGDTEVAIYLTLPKTLLYTGLTSGAKTRQKFGAASKPKPAPDSQEKPE